MVEINDTDEEKRKVAEGIGARLREVRLFFNLNQQSFASYLHTSTGFVSEVESGKKLPGVQLLHSLKRKFNIDTDWLLTGRGTMFDSNHTVGPQRAVQGVSDEAALRKEVDALRKENEELRKEILKLEAQVALLSELIIKIKKDT
ncbi:MAG: helix-turn-helix domain-containing protein [Chloroherpetonaceae bacterium]|nr:helix-turn-helix domain-containing protein [Chloroherpetonaceae bacterium]MDW8019782.1 helix-turn-helix domain-containing protein [Chloroherpetonaceae bacterium]